MQSPDHSLIAAALQGRTRDASDTAQVADAIVATWREIDQALTPIIGQRGIASLYKRSLYLTHSAHPWMAGLHEGLPTSMDLEALKALLAHQTSAEATAGGRDLLQTFHELLTRLIGPSLTERLLRSVWANSSSGSPPQDNSP